ncbi:MarR family winged helix-turn-helix transcriptional regulator [Carnobacterium maltaromaticum]|uniref:MarR family winged helix-turn-helix transcriptional regulator n=1 Tax=Carnobacterium maltaromaticum TaxID=2751 RepID=UPI0039B08046
MKEELINHVLSTLSEIQNNTTDFNTIFTSSSASDLSESQMIVLVTLSIKSDVKITDISKMFAMTPGAATAMCDKLEEKGYLFRIRSKKDRRVVLIENTKKATEIVGKLFTDFDLNQLEEMNTTLIKINQLFIELSGIIKPQESKEEEK